MNPVRVRAGGSQFRDLDLDEKACCLGYPQDYMKNGQGSHNKRSRLLGQTFSVQIIKHILSGLKDRFLSAPPCCIAACPQPVELEEQL